MLSLQVCFWISLASCLSSHSYWAFRSYGRYFWTLNPKESQNLHPLILSPGLDSGLKESSSLGQRFFREKINDQQQNTIASERGRHHSPAMTICGLRVLPWTQVCVCAFCNCVCREPGPLLCAWKQIEVTHHRNPKTRVCSHLPHAAHWPRERDAKIKWFLVRLTKRRQGAADMPTAVRVLREMECDQQHTKTCAWEHNFQIWIYHVIGKISREAFSTCNNFPREISSINGDF